MTPSLNADTVTAAARQLLDTKVAAVRDLATTRQALLDQQAALTAAERADAAAYTTAERAGWTTDELKRLGIDPPAKRAPGRPRTTRPTTTPAQPSNPAGAAS